MTAIHWQLHLASTHPRHMALSPFGYLLVSFGGLATGIGTAFLLWHLI